MSNHEGIVVTEVSYGGGQSRNRASVIWGSWPQNIYNQYPRKSSRFGQDSLETFAKGSSNGIWSWETEAKVFPTVDHLLWESRWVILLVREELVKGVSHIEHESRGLDRRKTTPGRVLGSQPILRCSEHLGEVVTQKLVEE